MTLLLMMPSDANGLEMLLTRLSAQVLTDVVNSLEVKRVNIRVSKSHSPNDGEEVLLYFFCYEISLPHHRFLPSCVYLSTSLSL